MKKKVFFVVGKHVVYGVLLVMSRLSSPHTYNASYLQTWCEEYIDSAPPRNVTAQYHPSPKDR